MVGELQPIYQIAGSVQWAAYTATVVLVAVYVWWISEQSYITGISEQSLSQPNSTSTQVGSDKVINRTTHHPLKLLRYVQATWEADFRYATLF